MERTARDMSQEQLGGAEFRPSYISRVESGQRKGSDRFWSVVAARLGVSEAFLRSGVDSEQMALTEALATAAQGDSALARRKLRQLLDSEATSSRIRAAATEALANVLYDTGEYGQAATLFRDRLEMPVEDPLVECRLRMRLARALLESGDVHEAADRAREGVVRAEQCGVSATAPGVRLRVTYAEILRVRGDLGSAAHQIEVARSQAGGSPGSQAATTWNAALVAADRGEQGSAAALARRAQDLYLTIGDALQSALVAVAGADIGLRSDAAPQVVEAQLREALPQIESLGNPIQLGHVYVQLGRAVLRSGDLAGADACVAQALAALGHEHTLESTRAHALRAQIRLQSGDTAQALASASAAAQHLAQMGARPAAREVWADLGEIYAQAGRTEEALDCYRAALGRTSRVHDPAPAGTRA